MAKNADTVEYNLNEEAIEMIIASTVCSGCGSEQMKLCKDLDDRSKPTKYLMLSVHAVRLLAYRKAIESINKALALYDANNAPYIKQTNKVKDAKIGNIRI